MDSSLSPKNLYEQALKLYEKNQSDEAVALLTSLLEHHPAYEDAYEALSVIFYALKRYEESITVIKKWIRLSPNTIMAHTNLSRCYVAKGMILEAEHEQGEARRLTWQAELKTKKQAMPKQNFEEQIERYKQVIAYDPKDVLGYFSLGRTYLEAGMKRDAVDILEKAIEVNPEHSSSYLSLGEALQTLGDKKKAAMIYQKGIETAEKRGDIMTLKKMQAHLHQIETQKTDS